MPGRSNLNSADAAGIEALKLPFQSDGSLPKSEDIAARLPGRYAGDQCRLGTGQIGSRVAGASGQSQGIRSPNRNELYALLRRVYLSRS